MNLRSLLTLSFALVSFQSLAAIAAPPTESWLGESGTYDEAALERLHAVLSADAPSWAIVEGAAKAARVESPKELLPFVKACDAGRKAGNTKSGKMRPNYLTRPMADLALSEEDLRAKDSETAETQRVKDGAIAVRIRAAADYLELFTVGAPTICLPVELDVRSAAIVYLHELVHFTAYLTPANFKFADEGDAEQFKTVEAYSSGRVLSAGDEVDAYIAQYEAFIRLDAAGAYASRPRARVPGYLKEFFNDEAHFIGKREELAAVVLEKIGYGPRMRSEYPKERKTLIDAVNGRIRKLKTLAETRAKEGSGPEALEKEIAGLEETLKKLTSEQNQ